MMNIQRRILSQLGNPYAVRVLTLNGKTHLLVASQAREKCLLFSPPDWKPSVVWEEPGGSVSLVPIPGREGAILAIQGFYPGFQSQAAGIVYARPREDVKNPWNVQRVIDMPFAHRFEIVEVDSAPYIIASTLCGGKAHRDDWSQPGAVYVGRIPDRPDGEWRLDPVLQGISKNHGMHSTLLDGQRVVLVSGMQGVFLIRVPDNPGAAWKIQRLIDHEVSDIVVGDIDGDGVDEIIAIEPFHGNTLSVYKRVGSGWQSVFSTEIHYGHALWCGDIWGETAVLIGCREGTKELALMRPRAGDTLGLDRVVLDKGVGPINVEVIPGPDRYMILSANQAAGEVVIYELS